MYPLFLFSLSQTIHNQLKHCFQCLCLIFTFADDLDLISAFNAWEPEGTYGYRITQQGTHPLELSESTLYPVLRRLQKDQLLTVYDAPVNGRNRRYYQITPAGRQQLAAYAQEWSRYRSSIDTFFREVE